MATLQILGWSRLILLFSLSLLKFDGAYGVDSKLANATDTTDDKSGRIMHGASDPSIVVSNVIPKGPFGPDTVPFEIFNSSDPVYMRAPVTVMEEQWKGRKVAVCKTGTFKELTRDVFQQFPAEAIGRFYFKIGKFYQWCSATQLGPNVILTAAHCVFNCDSNEKITSGTFFSQYYNADFHEYSPFDSYAAWEVCDNGIPRYDFAIVKLQKNISLSDYPRLVPSTTEALKASQDSFIYAYPAETKSGKVPVYSAVSPVSFSMVSNSQVEMDLSIEMGSSGSGAFLRGLPSKMTGSGKVSSAIVAVTSYEYLTNHCPNGFSAFQPGTYHPATLMAKLGLA